ncbi:MAG: HK97 family phage prohead protease [Gammaproteobacteria bacterium]|nr:HK97 family phage prohead protease [Gammaproteobacteria bacterium]
MTEEELAAAIADWFGLQAEQVLAEIRKLGAGWPLGRVSQDSNVRATLEASGVELSELLLAVLPAFYAAGWAEVMQDLGGDSEAGDGAESWARERVAEIVPGITATTAARIDVHGARAEEEAEDREEALLLLLAATTAQYQGWQGWRSEQIAATETTIAHRVGGRAAAGLYAATIAALEKRNVDAGDDRVCPRCRRNSAVGWISAVAAFPEGDPAVHPNCRCRVEYRLAASRGVVILSDEKRDWVKRVLPTTRVAAEAGDDGQMLLEGLAVPFGVLSDDLGGFREIISPSVEITYWRDDLYHLWAHDWSLVLGRMQSGTLEIERSEDGISFRTMLADTPDNRDKHLRVGRGDVTGMSFQLFVGWDDDDWLEVDDTWIRTVNKMELRELTTTPIPAYFDTDVSAAKRSLEQYQATMEDERRRAAAERALVREIAYGGNA